jgi:N6-L-threonylcarbamoyladenine synthase
VIDVVADRLRQGLRMFRDRFTSPSSLVAAGGVAANDSIRGVMSAIASEHGTVLVVPPPQLCTDNGAMIAWAGAERLALGLTDGLDFAPRARWPLSEVIKPPAARALAESAPPGGATAQTAASTADTKANSPPAAARDAAKG